MVGGESSFELGQRSLRGREESDMLAKGEKLAGRDEARSLRTVHGGLYVTSLGSDLVAVCREWAVN